MMDTKHLLTTAEAAEYLAVSQSYLKQARMRDRGPGWTPGPAFIKVGKNLVRYRIGDLERWLERHRVEMVSA